MNKKGIGILHLVLVLFALTVGMMFFQLREAGIDSMNATEILTTSIRNATDINLNVSITSSPELSNAINYFYNGLIKAYGEISVWIVKFVEQNPQAPYKLLLLGLILSILAPVIYYSFLMIICIFLIIKEWLAKRKENKLLKIKNAKD